MLQHRIALTCLATCFLMYATVYAAEKTVTAKVTAVDAAKNSITLGDQTLDVTRKTKITVDGKKATLADIKTGQQAKVTYDDGLEVAAAIVVGKVTEGEAAAVKPKSDVPEDGDKLSELAGTWIAVAEEADGKRMKKEDLKKSNKTLVITGEKFKLSWSGKTIDGKIELGADDTKNAIDLSGTLNGRAVVLRGIYELENNQLRLCYSTYIVNGEKVERPTKLETEEGGKCVSVTYERKK